MRPVPSQTASTASVCNVYIDGYNFYYSISKRDHDFLKLGWCNFWLLSGRLVSKAFPGARVGVIKYFTAPVSRHEVHPGEARRQELWLEALRLGTEDQVRVIKGYHDQHEDKPRVEKQTDTNLAISIVRDAIMSPRDARHSAFRGRDSFSPCNCVLLLSGDNDLLPAAEMVANYGTRVAIFRPVDDPGGRQNPIHPGIRTYRTSETDLRESMLSDLILREDSTAITWSQYLEMKIASEAVSPQLDREFFDQCQAEAANSDDNETKLGCVVRNPKGDIIARGHNALPLGVHRTPPERLARPGKYAWIEHAERNAIYSAARSGTSLRRCTMYVELMPCADCARGIIQSGIKEVVVSQNRMQAYSNSAYREQHIIAETLFKEAGIRVRMV